MEVIAEEDGVKGDFFIFCIQETACIWRAETYNIFGSVRLKIREFEEWKDAIECLIGVQAHRRIGGVGEIMDAASACTGFDGLGLKDDFLFREFLCLAFFLNACKLFYILCCF